MKEHWKQSGGFAIYVFVFFTLMLLLMLSGLDFLTSFSAVAATINNLGPGQVKL